MFKTLHVTFSVRRVFEIFQQTVGNTLVVNTRNNAFASGCTFASTFFVL